MAVDMSGTGLATAHLPSNSPRRKAASAMIAKIPLPLALHIARAYKPITAAAALAWAG